ncbi:MAG: DUF4136 domain-containing protein, partial [Sphingobacterium sp.]
WGWGGPWGYGFGYGYGYTYPAGSEKYRYAHLIVEALDKSTNSVIWQARGSSAISSPEKAINNLPKVIHGIFKEYPSK